MTYSKENTEGVSNFGAGTGLPIDQDCHPLPCVV